MKIHLIAVVGGPQIQLLPQMLRHYRDLGVDSFIVHVSLGSSDDPAMRQAENAAEAFGIELASVTYGDHTYAQTAAWKTRHQHPHDWFVIVDVDEFQLFPQPLPIILEHCNRRGFDHIKGCFIDRVAHDGRLPPFLPDQPLWPQYPIGLFLTHPVLRADPRKVVAARGHVEMQNNGHHSALSERGCPITDYFIPVHHFKWIGGMIERLEKRIEIIKRLGISDQWLESQRFLDYYRQNGRILIEDPSLLAGRCLPDYPHWDHIRALFLDRGFI